MLNVLPILFSSFIICLWCTAMLYWVYFGYALYFIYASYAKHVFVVVASEIARKKQGAHNIKSESTCYDESPLLCQFGQSSTAALESGWEMAAMLVKLRSCMCTVNRGWSSNYTDVTCVHTGLFVVVGFFLSSWVRCRSCRWHTWCKWKVRSHPMIFIN